MLYRDYLENPQRTGENRLPARSQLVPAQRMGITHENCTESDRVRCLDGDWKFRYLEKDTKEELWDPALPDDDWDTLSVPSMWQYHGYGSCLYPNVEYPFPYDPPHIHRDNPVGVYRRHFRKTKSAGRTILRFLGVDNAYFVYLNNTYIGFSKGSRIAAEFDVTDALLDGDNLLCVKVYTYSDASYLENQDMLLASGIFRSVYLIDTAETSLWDYTVLSETDGFHITAVLAGSGSAEMTVRLYAAEDALLSDQTLPFAFADGETAQGEYFLPVTEPHLWNAEDPYLYTLVFTVIKDGKTTEIHTKRVGIRSTAVVGNRLLLNGQPITLKGTNRHDNDPHEGKAIDAARIRAELTEIKANGLNAIRCSHYSQNPVFYEIASELGLYILDEADTESHGAGATGDQGALNKDPDWFPAFFDRISRMYLLNKNETCINIWSLGNECGGGENFARCGEWLRAQPVKKPLTCNGENVKTDFRETGYMTLAALGAFPAEGKPVMLIEYGHAMGNSPGGLSDIWNYIYTHEQICGGYVWEYKSHGFYEKGRNGEARYLYGGDFGDVYHWSNFSLDGYHTSDGTPKPSWEELGALSAPVYMEYLDGGIRIRNTWDFTPLDGVTLTWKVFRGGECIRSGKEDLSGTAPHESRSFAPELSVGETAAFCSLDLSAEKDGKIIAHRAFVLQDAKAASVPEEAFACTVTQEEDVSVSGEDFSVRIENGMLCSYRTKGKELLSAPMRPSFWRAPTDNDGITGLFPRKAGEWAGALIQTVRFGVTECSVTKEDSAVTVEYRGKLLPQSHYWGFDAEISYRITKGGKLRIRMTGAPYGGVPGTLLRIGILLTLPGNMRKVRWYGRGPGDSYPDRKENTWFGEFTDDVRNMNFRYDVPQETGSHEDTLRVSVSDPGTGVSVCASCDETAPRRFAFSCHDFSLDALTKARHRDELETDDNIYFYLDHKMRGLGSNSCGPDPEAPYELRPEAFEFSVCLSPEA